MATHTLEADSIIKIFGTRTLLSDCWVSCKTGEILGLIGRNGCGKSTLLKIIFGTTDALNKNVRIDGKTYQSAFASNNHIAYLPQDGYLPKSIGVEKLIDVYLEDQSVRQHIKAHPRIQPCLKLKCGELSGGTIRILEILLVMHLDVKFVLLDEPFNGVEPIYVDEIMELLNTYRETKGFIITDHNFREVITVCDKIILLHEGVCKYIKSLHDLERYNYVPSGTFDE
ncbi:ATP-binding cassette domain-containing protein [Chitinophaga sp. Hz27]|uniref:ATP-binding cassette domain-containing protein n=1 Tax=Chitinophaga sp. Hz27 TaxID=3347169 RepID=UPI0035D5FDBC